MSSKKSIDLDIINKKLDTPSPVATPAKSDTSLMVSGEYFRPTAKMRKFKEAFYLAARGQLPQNRSDINADFIKQFILGNDINLWHTIPGFMAWLRRDEAVADRLHRLYQLRLDAIEEILEDNTSTYTARDKINAGAELDKITKTISEAADALEVGKRGPIKSREEMIQEALDKARKVDTPTQIADKAKAAIPTQTEIVFPIN